MPYLFKGHTVGDHKLLTPKWGALKNTFSNEYHRKKHYEMLPKLFTNGCSMDIFQENAKYGKLKLLQYLAFSSYVMLTKIIQIFERIKQILIMKVLPESHALW